MTAFRAFRLMLLRWHRRIGVALLLFVVTLVVTGIAINHTEDLGLDQKFINHPLLLNRYGVPTPEVKGVAVDGGWLLQRGADALFFNGLPLGECDGRLLGGVHREGLLVSLCQNALLLHTADGQLLDMLTVATGLPAGLTGLSLQEGQILLRGVDGVFALDTDLLQLQPVADRPASWPQADAVPDAVAQTLLQDFRGEGVSWERFLLDLHSGRLFGPVGVWVVDIGAVLLLLIAVSGVWVWLTKPGRWR